MWSQGWILTLCTAVPSYSTQSLQKSRFKHSNSVSSLETVHLPRALPRYSRLTRSLLTLVFFSSYLELETDWYSKCKIILNFEILNNNKMSSISLVIKREGWRDGSAVKSAGCSSTGLGFTPHSHMAAHNCL